MPLIPESYDARFMKPCTTCRCGHILECCADCRDWLVEHSPRIVRAWRWYVTNVCGQQAPHQFQDWQADAAEADDRAYFGL